LGQRSETKATAREWPVSTYLVALALATFVPVTVCSAFLAYHFVSESSQLVRYEYEDKLRLMRNATELRVANIIEDLQVLALSPALQQGNFAAFKEHAIEAARLIGATAIVVYDPDGQQVMNTRLGPDQSLLGGLNSMSSVASLKLAFLRSLVCRERSWTGSRLSPWSFQSACRETFAMRSASGCRQNIFPV
jgi:hypothetical protein